jgi:hypothetical protein
MDDLVDRLKKIPAFKYHVHETEVCRMLHITATDGGVSARGRLSELLLALKEGHARLMMMDLEQGRSNAFNVHLLKHGRKEAFATDRLATVTKSNHVPCWVSFGLDQMDIKKQLKIMKSVTGEAPRMDKATSERRKATWLAWYQDKELGQEYNLSHLPTIARQYCDKWEAKIPENDDRSKRLDSHILQRIAIEIRLIHVACNRIPRRTRSDGLLPREVPIEESKEETKEMEESEDEHASPQKRRKSQK